MKADYSKTLACNIARHQFCGGWRLPDFDQGDPSPCSCSCHAPVSDETWAEVQRSLQRMAR